MSEKTITKASDKAIDFERYLVQDLTIKEEEFLTDIFIVEISKKHILVMDSDLEINWMSIDEFNETFVIKENLGDRREYILSILEKHELHKFSAYRADRWDYEQGL